MDSKRDEVAFVVVEAVILHQHHVTFKDRDGIAKVNAVLAGVAEQRPARGNRLLCLTRIEC